MSESSEPPSPLNEEPKDAAASAISNTLHKEEPAVDEHRVEEDSEDDDQTEVGDDEDGPSSPGVGESSPMTASVATTTATPSSARKSSIHKKTPSSHKRRRSSTASTTSTPSKRNPSHSQPNLELPFRTVKKAMKLDPDTPIVQNEAALMLACATEFFVTKLARDSHEVAASRGRNTIRYEDIAESRASQAALSFLETLFP